MPNANLTPVSGKLGAKGPATGQRNDTLRVDSARSDIGAGEHCRSRDRCICCRTETTLQVWRYRVERHWDCNGPYEGLGRRSGVKTSSRQTRRGALMAAAVAPDAINPVTDAAGEEAQELFAEFLEKYDAQSARSRR